MILTYRYREYDYLNRIKILVLASEKALYLNSVLGGGFQTPYFVVNQQVIKGYDGKPHGGSHQGDSKIGLNLMILRNDDCSSC